MHQAHLVLDTHTANALSLVKFIMRTSNDCGKSRQQKISSEELSHYYYQILNYSIFIITFAIICSVFQ